MNQSLQNILNVLEQSDGLSPEQKKAILDSIKETDKTISITEFKLDRTEKVKRTTAILLEETIAELEQKRKAVEEQNHELEVESALERVRSVALGMKKPEDMLAICKTIAEQLALLKIKEIRNIQTAIFYEEKGSYMNYQYYAKHDKTFITDTVYTDHDIATDFATQMLKGKGKFYITHIEGRKKLDDWIAYQKSTNVFIDDYLYTAESLSYYWYSLGPVALGISTYFPLTEKEENLFKRFLNVFELAYLRYLDIEKAEAQAREAEIQLALERVRARSLAMHHTSELQEVVNIVAQQLHHINIDINGGVFIAINSEVDKDLPLWASAGAADYVQKVIVPFLDKPFFIQLTEAIKKGNNFYVEESTREEKLELFQHLFKHEPWRSSPQERKEELLSRQGGLSRSVAVSRHTSIAITDHYGKKFSDEENEILKRFGNVFEQAYTRFLDLQKAEAQARDAQIEAALERIRASSMAMHHSDDLIKVINVVKEQLMQLGIHFHAANFVTGYGGEGYTMWLASPSENYPEKIYVPQLEQKLFSNVTAAAEQGKEFTTYSLSFEEKNIYFSHLFENTLMKNTSEEGKRLILESKGMASSAALLKKVRFNLMNLDLIPYTEEENNIIKRIAYVFEQSYTRFLDLQKAEAQTREAQIEAALEKVRSRSMGMQKSEELKEVIQLVYEQFNHLNIHIEHTGFLIDYKTGNDMHIWLADQHLVPAEVTIPWFDSPPNNSIKEAKEKGKDFFTYHLTFEEKNKFYRDLFKFIPDVPEETLEYYFSCPGLAGSGVLLESIGLYIENFSGNPYTDEENAVLMRFGKVFQQTFTRFLDLQMAEAQARESQIQLALERARAQSMMMQHSKELDDTLRVFHEQVLLLNIPSAFSFLWLPDEEQDRHIFWAAWAESNSTVFKSKAINYPLDRNEPATAQCLVDWKSHQPVVSYHVPPSGVKNYFAAWQELIAGVEQLKPEHFKDGLYYVEAFMKYGCFGVMVENELQDEEKKILLRFSIEFERTYTRFLDLQKAEAQAREAQIEAALEKVRAKVMSMKVSNDLNETSLVFGEQLRKLGIDWQFSYFWLIETDKDDNTFWITWPDNKTSTTTYSLAEADENFRECIIAWQQQTKIHSTHVPVQDVPALLDTFERITNDAGGIAIDVMKPENFKEGVYYYDAMIKYGSFGILTNRSTNEEEQNIQIRFATEFERAYTRFLDLKKAEAQAREAQIEAALERVRSRTMGMHRSDELPQAASLLFQQIELLGIHVFSTGYNIWEKDKRTVTSWMSSQGIIQPPFKLPLTEEASFVDCYNAAQSGNTFFVQELSGEKLISHLNFMSSLPVIGGLMRKMGEAGISLPDHIINHHAFFSHGYLLFISYDLVPDAHEIFKRFAKVFEQTYTRFLDLQKAEAQAREAQIEAALEKVRSRSLAMHKSDEIQEVVHTVFEKLKELNVDFYTAIIILFEEGSKDVVWWLESKAYQNYQKILVPYSDFSYMQDLNRSREEGIDFFSKTYSFEEKNQLFHHLFTHTELKYVPQAQQEFLLGTDFATMSVSLAKNTGVHITSYSREVFSEEDNDIFKRFTKVFDQAYTRFLDLQKAEAQAREAQIEAALEKVRSRTMAMQKSDELGDVAIVLFKELNLLVKDLWTCGFVLCEKDRAEDEWWLSTESGFIPAFYLPNVGDVTHYNIYQGWLNGEEYHTEQLEGEALKEHYDWLMTIPVAKKIFDDFAVAGFEKPKWQKLHCAYFSKGYLCIITQVPCPDEIIFKRFAQVFDLTYTRFLDLQKAEAQAREAQVEAALERVRSRTLAMHKSDELIETAQLLYHEFGKLGINTFTCGYMFIDEEKNTQTAWVVLPDGTLAPNFIEFPLTGDQVLNSRYEDWKKKKPLHIFEVQGEANKEHHRFLSNYVPEFVVKEIFSHIPDRIVFHCANFSNGYLLILATDFFSISEQQTIIRFANVFDLTYRRFLDLKKAEAQTREALIEGALERVRARALAMQQPEELKDVAQVLRNEMGALGVEELETSSIYIHGDSSENVECWYALQDPKHTEKKMVADHFVLDLDDTWVGREMKKFYLSDEKQTSIVMQGANRKEWINYCYERSPVFSGFYGETIPDRTYHLYKFSHGYIGAAAPGDISAESWRLLSRAASVFSLAYSRFRDLTQARNDLIKLKEEKKRAEDALTELQATQKQLIQSEKMASLGELTAGIAHEIQNPLNFVNNFSDVSNELLEEMKTELEKGNKEDAIAIVEDVKQNLEKILHHGKRADAIVKSMLQHSRSSNNKKESTDINALCDEYLRLSYHGLRAKDKSFNATMKTDFDESIGNINIITQDIGRVVLNLINNAFYVVDEKKRQLVDGYEPTVSVSTKKLNGKVEISVKDNGNGIPQKILEKIFQPFFTTKPTGQGTGLGLSLSYDIVKAHGGEIKVETKENEGTTFTIQLPANSVA